nr:Transposase, Tc1-like protein [Ipomoea batatas]
MTTPFRSTPPSPLLKTKLDAANPAIAVCPRRRLPTPASTSPSGHAQTEKLQSAKLQVVVAVSVTPASAAKKASRRHCSHLCRRTKVSAAVSLPDSPTGNVGRKRIQISPDDVSRIPLNRRTTIRSMATALNMSKTSLHRRVKEGSLKSHSNAIKPLLTEENRKVRLQFCISMIDSNSPPHNPSFIDMYDHVHIDEKWFFLSKSSQKYYLLPDEDEPYRTCKSKKFIAKVMFLCAVARPRFDSGRNEMFDGKIGIFPFIYKEAAKRRSKNREAGTLVTKPIESVNKEVTRKWLIDYVLPAIRAKWPLSSSKSIFIQQDNARPHISVNDAKFLEAAQKDGFDIRLTCQPPNSPDMNVLDLGFFRAIQSLTKKKKSYRFDIGY